MDRHNWHYQLDYLTRTATNFAKYAADAPGLFWLCEQLYAMPDITNVNIDVETYKGESTLIVHCKAENAAALNALHERYGRCKVTYTHLEDRKTMSVTREYRDLPLKVRYTKKIKLPKGSKCKIVSKLRRYKDYSLVCES